MAYSRTATNGDHVSPLDDTVTHTALNRVPNNLAYLGDEDAGAPLLKAYRSTSFTVSAGGGTTISYTDEVASNDPRSLHSTSTNPDRINIGGADHLGLWLVGAQLKVATHATAGTKREIVFSIVKNGDTGDVYARNRFSYDTQADIGVGTSTAAYVTVSGLVPAVETTDYVQIHVAHTAATTITMGGTSETTCNVFAMQIMGWL